MGLFSDIENAKVGIKSNYLSPGKYLVRIDKVEKGNTREGKDFVVFNLSVLVAYDDNNGLGHKAGETVSDMYVKNESFLGNIKRVISSIGGWDPEEITEELCEMVVGPEQPLTGFVILVEAFTVKTRKGEDFTAKKYQRRVPMAEVDEVIDPQVKKLLYPGDLWDQHLAKEAQTFS